MVKIVKGCQHQLYNSGIIIFQSHFIQYNSVLWYNIKQWWDGMILLIAIMMIIIMIKSNNKLKIK